MNKHFSAWSFGLLGLLGTQTCVAGLVAMPGINACTSQEQSAYNQGVTVGTAIGRDQGFQEGTANGIYACQQNPTAYGITVGQVLQQGGYGETEPNDNMVGANALVGGVPFIGQSYGPADRDVFYLVTFEPNQILNINFKVPGRDPATQDVSGWTVKVLDSAGNVYASFPTSYNQGNPNGDDEITYPVTLGLVGTYYVEVSPVVTQDENGVLTVPSDNYSLAVVVQNSDITSLPVAVNFFDAEVEPNNVYTDANPLATGVTMFGLINLSFKNVVTTVDGGGTAQWAQGEEDWYVYHSTGNEIVTLSFCNKQSCQSGDWFVDVFNQAGAPLADSTQSTPLVAFNTDSATGWPYTVNFGLKDAGDYYVRVNLRRKLEAPCLQTAPVQQCLDAGGVCVVRNCSDIEGKSCTPPGTEENPCECEDVSIGNCGIGNSTYKDVCWVQSEQCVQYGLTVVLPDTDITSQYNFTLYGTQMQPFTADSQAYLDYLARQKSTPTGGD